MSSMPLPRAVNVQIKIKLRSCRSRVTSCCLQIGANISWCAQRRQKGVQGVHFPYLGHFPNLGGKPVSWQNTTVVGQMNPAKLILQFVVKHDASNRRTMEKYCFTSQCEGPHHKFSVKGKTTLDNWINRIFFSMCTTIFVDTGSGRVRWLIEHHATFGQKKYKTTIKRVIIT